MNQFSAHRTDQTFSTAVELMITIIWVPERTTRLDQPLDLRAFGALKSKGRAKWRCFYAQNHEHPCNREIVAWLLLESWDELSHPDSIMAAARISIKTSLTEILATLTTISSFGLMQTVKI
jgi:hypothetical protein